MSNIVLQPNASGTGSITIATPNTNTDRTLNIPDVAGNLVTTGDTGSVTVNKKVYCQLNDLGTKHLRIIYEDDEQ